MLGKLKYYCQLCRRQCGDENGLKCHKASYYHRARQEEYDQNPSLFVEAFSREFLKSFISILNTQYGAGKRVLANTIYQSYISNKNHCHLNSTKWKSLTEFIWHLHDSRLIKAEEETVNGETKIFISSLSDISSVQERLRHRRQDQHQRGSALDSIAMAQASLYMQQKEQEAEKSKQSKLADGDAQNGRPTNEPTASGRISFKLKRF